ncbi:MAG: large conductance mechanosensitive channel protein MscL [Saprospiraceae bacterium]|nr:large conductance mechanosensitive channel protein MscL [Saprospiraceae bacterium]
MLKEFKEFAIKGNMLDMAVGIIIGAAFGTVVGSFVNDIMMPLISAITGTPDFSNLFIVLKAPDAAEANMASIQSVRDAGGVALGYGLFINAFISLLIVAFALFMVIKSVNKLKRKEEAAPAPAPAGPTAEDLLIEIRDLLKQK